MCSPASHRARVGPGASSALARRAAGQRGGGVLRKNPTEENPVKSPSLKARIDHAPDDPFQGLRCFRAPQNPPK